MVDVLLRSFSGAMNLLCLDKLRSKQTLRFICLKIADKIVTFFVVLIFP